tara:strand:- start:569 stop:1036 length:468 start_codon:yes stop_codon:yes gene_type:complete
MKQKEDRQKLPTMDTHSSQIDPVHSFMHKSVYDEWDTTVAKTTNKKQQKYMNLCTKLAEKSPLTHKHGCVIVNNGKIIGQGFNSFFSSSSIHAEIAALRNAKKGIGMNSELYVVRIGSPRHYRYKYSKPCTHCEFQIIKSNIKRVYYSTNELLNA